MMDTDKILAELAATHGVVLSKKDPLFAAVLLNKLILDEYIKGIDRQLAEGITNIAIKEDVTGVKLRKLLETSQAENRKETERILNQFADNLQGRIQLVTSSPADSKPTAWLAIAFLLGLLIGVLAVRFL